MLNKNQKDFVYKMYLKISLNEIAEILGVKLHVLNYFIKRHTVGEMLDKFDSLKKEGYIGKEISPFEIMQIEKGIKKREEKTIIIRQSKLNEK